MHGRNRKKALKVEECSMDNSDGEGMSQISQCSTLKREYITNLRSSHQENFSASGYQESTTDTLSTWTFDENSSTLSDFKFPSRISKRKLKELKAINEHEQRNKQTLQEIITTTTKSKPSSERKSERSRPAVKRVKTEKEESLKSFVKAEEDKELMPPPLLVSPRMRVKQEDFSQVSLLSLDQEGAIVKKEEAKKEVIDMNKAGSYLSSCSFSKRQHTQKWSSEETRKFYKSLKLFGTDFSMIAKLFPNRNRVQIKNKFRKEEKTNNKMVEDNLKKHRNKTFTKMNKLSDDYIIEKSNNQKLSNPLKSDADSNAVVVKYETGIPSESELQKDLQEMRRRTRLYSINSFDSMDMHIMRDIKEMVENTKSRFEL